MIHIKGFSRIINIVTFIYITKCIKTDDFLFPKLNKDL